MNMGRLLFFPIIVMLPIAASVNAQEPADALHAVTLSNVWHSWYARRDRCVLIEISWSEEITNSIMIPAAADTTRAKTSPPPATHSRYALKLDGPKSRLSEFKLDMSGTVLEERKVVFDGQRQRGLVRNERQKVLQGGISSKPTPLSNNTSTAPLVAVLRPFDGETRFFDPATAKIEAGSLVLDAFTAFPITFQMLGIEGYVRRVYVSAQSEYVPIQIDDLFGGRLVSTIRIQYTEDPAINGWMPIGWVTTVFGPTGDVIATSRGIVEDIRFPKLLEDDEFTLEFPVGTRYFDHDKNQRTFIVGQDGSAREFTPAQVASGATQEDLIEGREPSLNRWTAVRLGAVLLSLIALLIVAVKAFQKRRRSL